MTMDLLYLVTVTCFVVFSVASAWNCTEEEGFYQCKSGKCIPDPWVCDGARDCPDGDDEIHVKCGSGETVCSGLHFECVDPHSGQKKCARPEWRCDGFVDCAKGIDEENCERPQPQLAALPGQITPNNRGKIAVLTASSTPPDANDPENGTTCDDSTFKCNDGTCIDRDKVCDDNKDCKDGSDEAEQRCSEPPIRPLIQPGVPTVASTTTAFVATSSEKTETTTVLLNITQHTLASILKLTTPIAPKPPQLIDLFTKTVPVHIERSEESHDDTPKTIVETTKPYENLITTSETAALSSENIKMKPQRYAIVGNSNPATAKPLRSPVYGTPIVPVRNFQVLFPLHAEMKGSSKGISKASVPPRQINNESS
uniref:Very low-density lipoprotein receptor n=1 Tax=Panagrellus redivivus TaxID=6233 RepID=A0A7E4VIW5_PANRE